MINGHVFAVGESSGVELPVVVPLDPFAAGQINGFWSMTISLCISVGWFSVGNDS